MIGYVLFEDVEERHCSMGEAMDKYSLKFSLGEVKQNSGIYISNH